MRANPPLRVRLRLGQSFLDELKLLAGPVPGGGTGLQTDSSGNPIPGSTQYVTDTGATTTDPSQAGGSNESWISYTSEGLATGAGEGVVDIAKAAAAGATKAAGSSGLIIAGGVVVGSLALMAFLRGGRRHAAA